MVAKDIFKHLRVTTMEVTSPLMELLRLRGDFIKLAKSYIEDQPDSLAKYEMLQAYNQFAREDAEMVEVVQGKIDEIPRRVD